MRKKFLYFCLIHITCFVAATTLSTHLAYANGAVWNDGDRPGTPGPMKASNLVLLKEHVLFDDNPLPGDGTVQARFWIYNPTEKAIRVTMGFPLKFEREEPKSPHHKTRIDEFLTKFRVQINNTNVITKPITDVTGRYSVVYIWDMSFPPMKTTQYTAVYPLSYSYLAKSGGPDEDSSHNDAEISKSFTYITHTGAYWAKPIAKATFEYCSKNLVQLIQRAPSGDVSTQEKTQFENTMTTSDVTDRWSVKPKPYKIDEEKSCVVWERQDWVPRNPEDDIVVSTNHYEYDVYSEVSTLQMDLSLNDVLKRWCADSGDSSTSQHLGATEKLLDNKMTAEMYYTIRQKAFYYPEEKSNSQFENQFSELPSDMRTAYQMQLLRYLRNYIFAVHGHVFKDRQLAQCFRNVTKSAGTELSSTERWNVEWLLDYEKQLKE